MEWLREQIYNNFITDNRWRYLTNGLKVTLEVTFFAVLIGIVLGLLVAVVRSTYAKTGKMKIGSFLCGIYITVIRGTPVVVQLLIIYFVVFGSVKIDKVFVAIMAFGLNSGAYVAEIFRSGIMSIDDGQFEAGRSLGFSYGKTMLYIIMPQAFKNVLPALGNEFIVLLKETSVAGYIALEDLTKGGDIIRSRTFSAFFPLLLRAEFRSFRLKPDKTKQTREPPDDGTMHTCLPYRFSSHDFLLRKFLQMAVQKTTYRPTGKKTPVRRLRTGPPAEDGLQLSSIRGQLRHL